MKALRDDLADSPEDTAHRGRDPDPDTEHSPREDDSIVGLHDQVKVVALHGELDDTEAVTHTFGA